MNPKIEQPINTISPIERGESDIIPETGSESEITNMPSLREDGMLPEISKSLSESFIIPKRILGYEPPGIGEYTGGGIGLSDLARNALVGKINGETPSVE